MDGGFENIDFGSGPAHERAIIVHRSRMLLAGAGTTRQPLTGKIRKSPKLYRSPGKRRNAVQRLIGNGSEITCHLCTATIGGESGLEILLWRIGRRTIPSKVAPYSALPKLPIAQTAGHKPATPFRPGSVTATSIYPPVKQNWFQLLIIPPS